MNSKSILIAAAIVPIHAPLAVAATDITFFAVSDTHYGREYGPPYDSLRIATVAHLNALPGTSFPLSVGGGPIPAPRGVVMPGDLVDRSYLTRWRLFEADYGVNGEGRLRFPVYDGLGNHDVYNYGLDSKTDVIIDAFIARNAKRSDLANIDTRRYHYSWDWDQVHFVQLNLFAGFEPGPAPFQWDPAGSLEFLKRDLETHVGTSGRPVMIVQHFELDTSQYYSSNPQKEALVDLLKRYNCIGVLHGHTHSEAIYKYRELDVFSDGAAFKGDILIFRILEGRMFVVHRNGDAWGRLKFEKAISMGTPMPRVAPATASPRSTGFTSQIQVALASATAGAVIHYTLDGSRPTILSPVYSQPLTLLDSDTLRFRAFKPGSVPSAAGTEIYVKTATPTSLADPVADGAPPASDRPPRAARLVVRRGVLSGGILAGRHPSSIACFDSFGVFTGWATPTGDPGSWRLPRGRSSLAFRIRYADGSRILASTGR